MGLTKYSGFNSLIFFLTLQVSQILKFFPVFIIFITLFLLSATSYSQKEGNIWYFGENAGLDFNVGAPIALTGGALITNEGSSAISDGSGNLLFYTDGSAVLNRNHIQMPNGFGLKGHSSSTQTALIVQKPGDSNIYYIFTTPAQVLLNGNTGFHYSIVDMTLDGGLGNVTLKNIQLFNNATEKLTAVRHANGCDIWIIMHEWNSNRFRTYLVSKTGVNNTPVISSIGSNHTGGGNFLQPNTNAIGQMKVSPDGNKLALAIYSNNIIELFDFNKATGVVSNPVSFPPILAGPNGTVYGVEFSPDATKLYVGLNLLLRVFQYNLTAGSSIDIINSGTPVGSTSSQSLGALQLGPDGKIYCALFNQLYLAAINNPNALGIACNYVDSAVYLQGKISKFGLPTFMQSHFYPPFTYANACKEDTTFFSVTDTLGVDSVSWNFGDPSSGILNTSTNLSTFHVFSQGIYNVQLTIYSECKSVYSRTVIIDSKPNFSLGNDTLLCPGTFLELNVEVPMVNYLWPDSSKDNSFIVSSPGIYWVELTNGCGSTKDSIEIEYFPDFNINIGNDTSLCERQTLALNATVPGANYIWQDNSANAIYIASFPGVYWVEVISAQGCSKSDSIIVSYLPLPDVNIGTDTLLCQGQTLELNATTSGTSYLWQDGSINSVYPVSATGLYWVKVTDDAGCLGSDSVNIRVEKLKADFRYEEIPCTNQIQFINLSSDTSSSFWNFGDGMTSNENNPLHTYKAHEKYTVILIANLDSTCTDTAIAVIPYENDAFSDTLFIPNVFTPNGDGKNDYFEIKGMNNPCIDINRLIIFNRWGRKVYEAEGNELKWDGKSNGNAFTDGVYFYVLKGEEESRSGSVTLLK